MSGGKAPRLSLPPLALLLLAALASGAWALPCFMHSWGGAGKDRGRALALAADSSHYLFAGCHELPGASGLQAWLLRTDLAGDSLGSRQYGGSHDEYCLDLCAMPGGGWALAGSVEDPSGDWDLWAMELDSDLDTVWSSRLELAGADAGYAVVPHPDGGVVVAGSRAVVGAQGYAWLVRFDSAGDTLWTRTFGAGPLRLFNDLLDTGDGLAGAGLDYVASGDCDFWLAGMDYDGQLLWDSAYGGTGWEVCYSLDRCGDRLYLGGYTTSFGAGMGDFWLLRVTDDGEPLGDSVFGGADWERCYALTSQGTDCLMAGYTRSYVEDSSDPADCWLVRTDSSGCMLWSVTYGTDGGDYLWSALASPDGGCALTGYLTPQGHNQLLGLRVDSLGEVSPSGVEGESAAPTPAPSLRALASPVMAGGEMAFQADPAGTAGLLEVFDGSGRRIAGVPVAGPGRVSVAARRGGDPLPAGVYVVRLRSEAGQATIKMSLLPRR